MKRNKSAAHRALEMIRHHDGLIRTRDALAMGIHPRTLYTLRDEGALEPLSRGVYRLAGEEPVSNPDLVAVAIRYPKSVICLISALAFHELTTQVPHAMSIALPKGSEEPRIKYPPVQAHRYSKASFESGIEQHKVDGVPIRIYCPEKTIADCFKFRKTIGKDVILEALKLYRGRRGINVDSLLEYARICRVESTITPYLEALL